MRVPKDVYGRKLADHLIRRWSFVELRQTGSHIIIRTESPHARTISIPAHKPVKPGTLRNILDDVATHKAVTPADILRNL